jgi:tetratricopeptide (TPR) repeat protein
MGKGFGDPIEFYGYDSCNCSINPKLKIIPRYKNLFQVKEVPCSALTEEIHLSGIGQFASVKPINKAEFNSNFSGQKIPDTLITFLKDPAVDVALLKILDPVGLRNIITDSRIIVEAANVENAQASIIGGKRYIFYNPAIISKVLKEDYASIGVLAHELAHHIFFQDIGKQTSPERLRALELEADEWAGYILRYMNAPIDSALLMTTFIVTQDSTSTHPGKNERIKYIIKGWKRAEETRLSNMVDSRYTVHFSAGTAYANQGDFKRAIDEFTLSINYHPFFSQSFLLRAKAKIELHEYASAIPDLNVFINYDSMNADAYLNRSYCCSVTGNSIQALKDADQAFRMLGGMGTRVYEVRGIALYFSGKFNEAISDLTKAIDSEPERAGNATYYRALSYARLQQFKPALKDYSAILRHDSTFVYALFDRGVTYYHLKNYDSALIDINKVLKLLRPRDSTNVMYQRALVFEAIKNYPKAISDFNYVIVNNPTATSLYWQRGNWKMEIADYKGAIEDYSKAIQYFPHVMDGYTSRGYAYFKANDYLRTLEDFKYVSERQELSEFYQIYYAIAIMNTGDIGSGVKTIEKLQAKYPHIGALSVVLGAAKLKSGKYPQHEILADIENGISKTVDTAALGLGYFIKGELYEDVFKDKKKACENYSMSRTYNFADSEDALKRLKCKKN